MKRSTLVWETNKPPPKFSRATPQTQLDTAEPGSLAGGNDLDGGVVPLVISRRVVVKVDQTVSGKFYVDNTCIDCGLCPDTAPTVFQRFDEVGYSIVHRQPATPQELALAEEARNACPTESIGNDGE